MVRLGKYIEEIPDDLAKAMEEAHLQNNWFTPHFIAYALEKIRTQYLSEDKLQQWIDCYPGLAAINVSAKKVGMVMAGNIPLAGFHDFLCGFISGQRLLMKLSSKDAVLLKHFLSVLAAWEPLTAEILQTADLLKGCDAYIATGSDNSARYFEYYFAAYPHFIRRNRTSIALLDGSETATQVLNPERLAYVHVARGALQVNGIALSGGDGALLDGETTLTLHDGHDAEVLVFDLTRR